MLAIVLAVALAATPAPKPTATNPFTLDPIQSTPPPLIGTTHNRPLCSALRTVVAPALQAAMATDASYKVVRAKIFDYVVKDNDASRDLHLLQMDREVDHMNDQVEKLKNAVDDPLLIPAATASSEDQKSIKDLKTTLNGILQAQKMEESIMSGFVETERMRRFAQPSETQQQMMNSMQPNLPAGAYPTMPPITGFLNDQKTSVADIGQHQVAVSLHDAHKLDDDLGAIQSYTGRWEDAATRVIVAAAARCR
ncbi:MAG TPA: hypothetical protein VMD91_03915 [Candidatus Sulfotelmatobacter sp.]|nr:hypothetical protein [Candidatus Sulfotelmatobacter sp.]